MKATWKTSAGKIESGIITQIWDTTCNVCPQKYADKACPSQWGYLIAKSQLIEVETPAANVAA